MRYLVVITEAVERTILEQARFIAVECESPRNAARWLDSILGAIDSLERFPRRCPLAPENEWRPREIRVLNVSGYLVLFQVDDGAGTVRVIGARHGRQTPGID